LSPENHTENGRNEPGIRERLPSGDQLCESIDEALKKKPGDFDDLIQLLIEEGYEYKAGKQPAVRGKGQKRFIPSGHWERDISQKISGRSLPVRKRWSESQRETGKECRFKRTGSCSS
jgi:hypothetical protein